MSFKKHINHVTKNFFLSTRVPLKAFEPSGNLIHALGYNQVFDWVFDNHDIYIQLYEKLQSKPHNSIATILCLENIYFTACPICPKSLNRGIFILGPYSTDETNRIKAVYKPSSLIPHLLSFLESLCEDCPNRPLEVLDTTPYSLHVRKAIDYIGARYTDPISLTGVADYLNISKPYFCQLFKEETKQTFTGFLNKLRVEKSKELLLESNLSMLDVALSVGYNNQNYYNIMFKKITNQTPLEFRKGA